MGDIIRTFQSQRELQEWIAKNQDEMNVHRMLRTGIIQGLDNIKDKINPRHGDIIYFISGCCATKITFQSQVFNFNEPQDFIVILKDSMKEFIQKKNSR